MICAFTGHRPERLPWGLNEDDARCAALKTLLRRTVREVYDRGFHTFLCGMAQQGVGAAALRGEFYRGPETNGFHDGLLSGRCPVGRCPVAVCSVV